MNFSWEGRAPARPEEANPGLGIPQGREHIWPWKCVLIVFLALMDAERPEDVPTQSVGTIRKKPDDHCLRNQSPANKDLINGQKLGRKLSLNLYFLKLFSKTK